ncbi:class B sortase [Acutalibacter muris]|uniref:Class B sortase n=2 Tax=Acutalibacter muris TaxID=1796620 RepID=A0A1Z2XWH4_9FIRM|nr:SrtB family sortase [Hungateiclostridiaceae bacterium KB18]ASB42782.1 SrtB family sortase [Acutalibacter muris]QQR32006.1 class B sortase [Acutalibacter muris]
MIAGAALFAALLLFSGVMLCREIKDSQQSAQAFETLAKLVVDKPKLDIQLDGEASRPEDKPSADEPAPEITAAEKYAAIHEKNNDFVGWLRIEDTNINYPVMQSTDNPNFYLKHNFDKEYSNYGVPYVQENCELGVSDNTIIYGHHMDDGSMFADLCKYESEDFYREHKTIQFDTMDGFGKYEVVAVFKTVAYSNEGFPYFLFVKADKPEDFDDFIAKCKELALYDTGVTAEYGDKLITLSTCEYSRDNGRMVIVAKKTESAPEVGGDA